MKYRVHTEYSLACNSHSMAVIQEHFDGSRAFLQHFQFKKFAPHIDIPREEAFALTDDWGTDAVKSFLQAMMDAAWDFGLRPKQVKDHTDELKAVRYHLEDMRKLALGGTNAQA